MSKGSVHQTFGSFRNMTSRERDKGSCRAPLANPRGPAGNRCCALHSPPTHLPAVGSTRRPVSFHLWSPSMASRPCHLRFGSPISAGTQPLAVRVVPKNSLDMAVCALVIGRVSAAMRQNYQQSALGTRPAHFSPNDKKIWLMRMQHIER
ncbi:hypothetical protein GA0061070_100853 [Kosakonia oryziphila]|uniref:Uncharacterized protein n=1 Tax=Kosakonia oryziphila TaxID=1005667 RepID=A0A1C4BLG7_9ENTR|nr:hypothetical protein GA0061070_100853 [Kosakonia oryziphila]